MPDKTPATISEYVFVDMRDGVRISAHIHRPDTKDRVPAIAGYTPYRKGPLAGPPAVVAHGYASVTWDIRGTGDSSGFNDSIYSDAERQDGYDMIQWIADQPWCTGSVGLWGISFGAVVALQMAKAAPPALKAIIARSGTDDPYREWTNPGGSMRPYMPMVYAAIMAASNFGPPDPAAVGDQWADMWRDRLDHNTSWGLPFLEHLVDSPFWRDRSLYGQYDRVQCAAFLVGGWADWYPTPLLRTFANLSSPKRALVGPWSHQFPDAGFPGPAIDWQPEAMRWWDHWLKGIDTGVMDEPPVTLWVRDYQEPASIITMDQGRWRCENHWPPQRMQATPYYLHEAGELATTTPGSGSADANQAAAPDVFDAFESDARAGMATGLHGGGPFNVNVAMPLDQRLDDAFGKQYTTVPFSEDVEIIGRPVVALQVSATMPVAQLACKLCDVAPDGSVALITKATLTTSHRESHTDPTPITPGQVYAMNVELLACAYRIKAGHRLRLMIAGGDFMNAWPTPYPGEIRLHRSPAAASHVVIPMAPADSNHDTADVQPGFTSLEKPGMTVRAEDQAKYEIRHNPITREAGIHYLCHYAPTWIHEATYTVSAERPDVATIDSASTRTFEYAGGKIDVAAHILTSSDAAGFHQTVQVDASINGRTHAQRSWERSVGRQGL